MSFAAIATAVGFFNTAYNMNASSQAASDARRASIQQARIERERSIIAAGDILEEGAQVSSAIRAQSLASGVEISGSPYVAMQEAITDSMRDAKRTIKYGAQQAEFISASGRAQASAYRRQGTAAAIGGATQAFTNMANFYRTTEKQGS